tara:strand:- start:85 stop:630 length:546 start_codon:yes stop_codon:yes gene_type:complete
MKKLLLLSLLISSQLTFSQEELNLNKYKYIVIENLFENSTSFSREGFSEYVTEKLLDRKKGKIKYFVVNLNATKPDDLIKNPNLGLYINGYYSDTITDDINLKSKIKDISVIELLLLIKGTSERILDGYRRAYFEFYDYEGNLVKTVEGCDCTLAESVDTALYFMTEFDYKYIPTDNELNN